MSDPRPVPLEQSAAPHRAHNGPPAAVIAFRRRGGAPVAGPVSLAPDTAPTAAAPPPSPGFERRTSSLHEPAQRASVIVATSLAIAIAIAGVGAALSLSGVLSSDRETGATDAPTIAPRNAQASWRHGWGSLPRSHTPLDRE